MEAATIPYVIYAESTPNPNTMKFVANKLLLEHTGSVEYTDSEEVDDSLLAQKIFNFPFVDSIFLTGNFITITKNDVIEWEDAVMEIREFIQNYLNDGGLVMIKNYVPKPIITEKIDGKEYAKQSFTDDDKRIIEILDEYIRPAVENDGGAIDFKSYKNGIVTVSLKGSCSGCPSASVTLKNGIESLLKNMMPEVREVVAHEI